MLCVAFANFLFLHNTLTKARASCAEIADPPETAYLEPRSLSAFSIIRMSHPLGVPVLQAICFS